MSVIAADRQYLMDLVGAKAFAEFGLQHYEVTDAELDRIREGLTGDTPIADLVRSALGTDGSVVDEAAYTRLLQVVDGTR
ncbi:hypothetical protein ACWKSP_22350 [Micromonosporaceae bacterium Da 78-11]